MDKDRGFDNGALGVVHHVIAPCIFIARLTTGTLVLVHPVCAEDGRAFLPCTYGYASTIRRCQGSTLDVGCIYFDHCYPPERGYGYVAASRFKTREGVYHFGKLRRTDWLPVGGDPEHEQIHRSEESEDENDSDAEYYREMEEVHGLEDSESDDDDDLDREVTLAQHRAHEEGADVSSNASGESDVSSNESGEDADDRQACTADDFPCGPVPELESLNAIV
jgi:hypothetical protein